jgi:hypothetical protein
MRIVHKVYRSMKRVWVANSMRKNMYILLDQNTLYQKQKYTIIKWISLNNYHRTEQGKAPNHGICINCLG